MKTKPFPYQQEIFDLSKDMPVFAILWEQGTGKTKLTIDTVCHNYVEEQADAVILIAPPGVHTNWRLEQWPKHGWDEVPARFFEWDSGPSKTKKYQKRMQDWLEAEGSLPILTCIYDSVGVKGLQKAFKLMLKKFKKIVVILDESGKISNPKAIRTRVVLKLGKMKGVVLKRILTGTPGESPFKFFSQFNFLDEDILNCTSYVAFKSLHGVFVKRKACNPATGKEWEYNHLLSYRNIDFLQHKIAPYSSRVLKKDVQKDLPPKLYDVQRFNLTARQEEAYRRLQNELFYEVDGKELTINHKIVLVGKLQQICNGFLIAENKQIIKLYDKIEELPKIRYMLDFLEQNQKKISVRAKHTEDVDHIVAALNAENYPVARYDGRIKKGQPRYDELKRFETTPFEECAGFIAGMGLGTMGIDVLATDVLMFYTHTFIYDDRVQCEDRSHRIGQKKHLNVIDLIMHGTVEELFVTSHATKTNVADLLVGDQFVNLLKEYHRG